MSDKIHIVPARKTTFGQTCIHYKASSPGRIEMPKHCAAGICYKDVSVRGEWKYRNEREGSGGPQYTMGKCSPCHRDYNFGGAVCDKVEFPSEQEIDDHLNETRMLIERVGIARRAIMEHCGGKRGVRGSLSCPVCVSGTLHYSVAGYNGHVHAKCDSAGCVAWME